jgi:hypothetical protein
LNPAGGIAQIHKVALAHIAVSSDTASRAKHGAVGEFFAHLRDSAGGFVSVAEGVRAARLESFQFFAPLRDETVFVVHLRAANLKRWFEMNSQNHSWKALQI